MITFLLAFAFWVVPASVVLVLLARGRRRRDRQAAARQRALRARNAASWGRGDIPGPTTPDRPADGRTRPRHRRPR